MGPSHSNSGSTEVPVPSQQQDGGEAVSHFARSATLAWAYVQGERITALCGKTWMPSQDPAGLDLCPACRKRLAGIRNAKDN